jgi:Chromatin remodeling factor Mit1 C-terminal Zn finger 2
VNYVPSSPNFLHTSDIEAEPETDDEFEAPPDAVEESDDEPDQYDVVADSSLLEPAPRRRSHSQLQPFNAGQMYVPSQQTAKNSGSTSAGISHPWTTFPYSLPGIQASLPGPSFQSKPLTVQGDRGLSRLPIPPNPIQALIGPSPGYTHQVECNLCRKLHKPGECSLRKVEIEQCPACGYHHFHVRRICPLLQDADYVEAMYERLKESTEDPQMVKAAKQYLTGVKSDLALRKRIAGQGGATETETSSYFQP